MLLDDEEWRQKSDRAIAEHCRVGHPLVADVRAELFPPATSPIEASTGISSSCEPPAAASSPTKRVGRDGKVRKVKAKKKAAKAKSKSHDGTLIEGSATGKPSTADVVQAAKRIFDGADDVGVEAILRIRFGAMSPRRRTRARRDRHLR